MFFFNTSVLLFLFEAIYLVICVKIKQYSIDTGNNLTIPCTGLPHLTNVANVMWIYEGKDNKQISRTSLQDDGSLQLIFLERYDSGIYKCTTDFNDGNTTNVINEVNVTVRSRPPPLVNVTVHPSTILALILWDLGGDGGHPIIDFTAEYRSADPPNPLTEELEPWRPISPNHISPNSRQIDVYHLEPNSSYWFRVWATNILGPGSPVEVIATTLYNNEEEELARHFLTGAEGFDPRTWVAAVAVVMGTLVVLAAATSAMLYRECRRSDGEQADDGQVDSDNGLTALPKHKPPFSVSSADIVRTDSFNNIRVA